MYKKQNSFYNLIWFGINIHTTILDNKCSALRPCRVYVLVHWVGYLASKRNYQYAKKNKEKLRYKAKTYTKRRHYALIPTFT